MNSADEPWEMKAAAEEPRTVPAAPLEQGLRRGPNAGLPRAFD
jgi:hypothetical protein